MNERMSLITKRSFCIGEKKRMSSMQHSFSHAKRDEEEEEKEKEQQRKNDHFRCLSAFCDLRAMKKTKECSSTMMITLSRDRRFLRHLPFSFLISTISIHKSMKFLFFFLLYSIDLIFLSSSSITREFYEKMIIPSVTNKTFSWLTTNKYDRVSFSSLFLLAEFILRHPQLLLSECRKKEK